MTPEADTPSSTLQGALAATGLVALGCAVFLMYLMMQLDRTRQELLHDGVPEFSLIQQIDHYFDNLVDSVMSYRLGIDQKDTPPLRSAYINHFEQLDAALTEDSQWIRYLREHESANQLIEASRAFVDRYEPLMRKTAMPDEAMLMRLVEEARALAQLTYETAVTLSVVKTRTRDDLLKQLVRLRNRLWITGLVFFVTTCIALGCLYRHYQRR